MNVSKLSIGTFIPKKGLKTIHVKNPADSTVECYLSLASRIQKQEALEAQLAKATEKAPLRAHFDLNTQTITFPEAYNKGGMGIVADEMSTQLHFKPGYLDASKLQK